MYHDQLVIGKTQQKCAEHKMEVVQVYHTDGTQKVCRTRCILFECYLEIMDISHVSIQITRTVKPLVTY